MECAEVDPGCRGDDQNGNSEARPLRSGMVHLQRGEYERAVADFTQALHIEPDNVIAYANRAAARAELGEQDAALVDLDRALEIDAGFALALDQRGDVFLS